MRKFFFLILFLAALSSKGQTSVYHPFPDSNAVWNIHAYKWCGFMFDTWEHYYSLNITGDTIISSINYHKIAFPIEVIESNGQCSTSGIWTSPGYYVGSVRQDIAMKKVFFVPPTETTEQLLYDFNLQVGDTVKGYIETMAFLKDVVQSIDSVLVGSTYRKRWYINPWYNIYFIEGVGSTYGLIEKSPGNLSDQYEYMITCFSQNDSTLYPNTTTNCELITSVKNISKEISFVNISPNPFHTSAQLSLSKDFEKAEIKIYNALGALVREDVIQNRNSYILNRNSLPDGIYFFKVSNDKGGMVTGKFVLE